MNLNVLEVFIIFIGGNLTWVLIMFFPQVPKGVICLILIVIAFCWLFSSVSTIKRKVDEISEKIDELSVDDNWHLEHEE